MLAYVWHSTFTITIKLIIFHCNFSPWYSNSWVLICYMSTLHNLLLLLFTTLWTLDFYWRHKTRFLCYSSYQLPTVLSKEWNLVISPHLLCKVRLTWSYVGNHSCCEFLSMMTMLCPENNILQHSTQPPALTFFPFLLWHSLSQFPVNGPTCMHIWAVLIVPSWLNKEWGEVRRSCIRKDVGNPEEEMESGMAEEPLPTLAEFLRPYPQLMPSLWQAVLTHLQSGFYSLHWLLPSLQHILMISRQ